eukprot:scaffold1399_cov410-Prasinococcus_capsulatus_cf.AAC.34
MPSETTSHARTACARFEYRQQAVLNGAIDRAIWQRGCPVNAACQGSSSAAPPRGVAKVLLRSMRRALGCASPVAKPPQRWKGRSALQREGLSNVSHASPVRACILRALA